MKKVIYKLVHLLIIVLAHLLISSSIFAQAPQKMSYQAIIRNSNDSLLISTPVGMRISLVQGSPSGIVVFSETQTATTNDNGLVSLQIGMGTAVSGTFASINWAAGPYYVKTETDLNGGINYTIISSNELLSVPYALFSATGPPGATGPQGPQGITGTNGNDGSIGPQGLNGLTALVKTTADLAGANCATGGTKIETGLDANNNGILDIGEVITAQTTYVCNGAGGAGGFGFNANHGYLNLANDTFFVANTNRLVEVILRGGNGGSGGYSGSVCPGGSGGWIGGNAGLGAGVRFLLNVAAGDTLYIDKGQDGINGCSVCIYTGVCNCCYAGQPGTMGTSSRISLNSQFFQNFIFEAQAGTNGGASWGSNGGNGSNGNLIYGNQYNIVGAFVFESNIIGQGAAVILRW